MKHAHLLSLFAAAAGAAVLKAKAANYPNYSGIQFGSDRKLSISVFSDLHFGERELSIASLPEPPLTVCSLPSRSRRQNCQCHEFGPRQRATGFRGPQW
jgi:hypothetical protein